uniref:BAR domain-containing protein n=2 Tax=Mesocestoides corti TaxID=53468 RepID=A0A5K3FLR6_MESCO
MSGSFGKAFNRLTQAAGELVNIGDKTQYPSRTVELINQIDQMKTWLNKLITATEQYVDITVATKMVETFQKNKEKTTTSDRLGAVMEEVATQSKECAPKLSQMLLNASDVQKGLATAKKNFNTEINTTYIDDLKSFLNNEVKEAQKAKSRLEEARLDLDSNKNRLKNTKSAEQKAKLEAEMRKDEAEFDKVHKEAVAIFEETCRKFDEQNVQLTDLVRAQKNFFDACSRACAEMVGA